MTYRLTTLFRVSAAVAALTLVAPAWAQQQGAPDPGSYLAARQAGLHGDYAAAARYFQDALFSDPGNAALMDQTITAYLGTGQVTTGAQIARSFVAAGGASQIANITLMSDAAARQDWDAIFDGLEQGREVGPLLDGLAQGWAFVGQGQMDRALDSFDELTDTPGLTTFGQQHKALALTLVGDLEGAEALYALPPGEGINPTRRSVLAHIRLMTQLDRFDEAQDLFDRAFSGNADPELEAFGAALAAGDIPPRAIPVTKASQGIGLAFLMLTEALRGDADDSYLLLFAQAGLHITPNDADMRLMTARLLNDMGQHNAAASTYGQVLPEDPAFYQAEIGRAEALRAADRLEEAVEVLTQLTRSAPDRPLAYASLGDTHRQSQNFERAVAAYTQALDRYDTEANIRWWVLYTRGIANERLNNWTEAEADFRASLELNPGHPSVLNYLGYSLVDREISSKYDEALQMIEEAVAARPDSGAITDSLAWVYYKLGRYQEAVAPMERAAELEPNDPIISDHLGDVYWMVGRDVEARFQWRRALSFQPEEDEANRIRRKLEIGLDAVYAEEGTSPAPAVEVADDDG